MSSTTSQAAAWVGQRALRVWIQSAPTAAFLDGPTSTRASGLEHAIGRTLWRYTDRRLIPGEGMVMQRRFVCTSRYQELQPPFHGPGPLLTWADALTAEFQNAHSGRDRTRLFQNIQRLLQCRFKPCIIYRLPHHKPVHRFHPTEYSSSSTDGPSEHQVRAGFKSGWHRREPRP